MMKRNFAPFRVHAPPPVLRERGHAGFRPSGITGQKRLAGGEEGDPWLTRLVKLIPAEVIAVYLAGLELAKEFIGPWAVVCFLLVLVSRIWGTRAGNAGVQWIGVVVSGVSFIIWVYAMGNYFYSWELNEDLKAVPSLSVLVWTFLVPYFYKGE